MVKYLAILALLLLALPVLADAAKTVSIAMLVEQDPWTAACEDDAKVPGTQGFGAGYSGLGKPFTPGHAYRVSGRMGWDFRLTVDADGNPSVGDVHAGPHLAAAPEVKIGADDPLVKHPVLVLFGSLKEVTVAVPVDYLAWEIPGAYEARVGNRLVTLPDGIWEMRGVSGWALPFTVKAGVYTPGTPVNLPDGADGGAGLTVHALKAANRVTIDVPKEAGGYRVLTADGKVLLPDVTGAQTAHLPAGTYTLQGSGWKTALTVTPGHADFDRTLFTPRGYVCYPSGTGTALMTAVTPTVSVPTPWGWQSVDVPKAEQPAVLGVGWSKDKQNGLLLLVENAIGRAGVESFKVQTSTIHGTQRGLYLNYSIKALDGSDINKAAVKMIPDAGSFTIEIDNNLPSGAYMLTVSKEFNPPATPVGMTFDPTPPPDVLPSVSLVLLHRCSTPAASLWYAVNRTSYHIDEPVEVCAWQGVADKQKPRKLILGVLQGEKFVALHDFTGAAQTFTLPAGLLGPGEYTLALRDGEKVVARRALTMLPDQPASHFRIHAYETLLGRGLGDVDKLNSLGVNAFLDQQGISLGQQARADVTAESIATLAAQHPEIGPAARYGVQGGHFLDYLDKLGWKFYAQWGSAHQPYGYGITFTDPTVVDRLTMTSLWTSQYGRQHPSFLGMNIFDEGGTPRGPRFTDDGSYLEYDAFAKSFGRPKPLYYGDDNEAARAWIFDKSRQHDVIYSGIGNRLDEVNRLADPGAHLFLGTQNGNLNSMAVDGGHPPIAYKDITLSTMHWYPDYFYTSFILLGNEYNFMQPKPIEFWPLIWADGHFYLTRHEANLAISRQVDGVGYFHWPAMVDSSVFTDKVPDEEAKARADGYKALHARYTQFGDLFRTVRRDRPSEVAVLYSLYDFAPTLFPKPDDAWFAYNSAYQAVYTGYLAIVSCLRKGLQAGWVCDEEILQRDGLAGRKALIVPGITAMRPEMKAALAAFIKAGGTVFVDGGTTVDIPGAKRLNVDFAKLVKTCKLKHDGDKWGTNLDRLALPEALPALDPVAALMGAHVQSASDDLLVTRQVSGKGQYFYCVNEKILPPDQLPELNMYKVQKYHQPIDTTVTLPVTGAVYDVFAGKKVADANGSVTLPVKLEPGEMALFAVLPEAIGGVTVHPAKSWTYNVNILSATNVLLPAAIPLEIHIQDIHGTDIRSVTYRSTSDGSYHDNLHLGLFDPDTVKITVRELLSGTTGSMTIHNLAKAPAITTDTDPVIVENAKALPAFFAKKQPLFIALGDGAGAPSEADVAPLVQALGKAHIPVEVRRASELTRKGFDVYVGRSFWRLQSEVQWNAGRTYEIDRPVIAVGNSDNNALIRYAVQAHNWTRYADRGFPGAGHGYVAYCWQPFSLTDDSVLAIGDDAKGIKEAVAWLSKQVK